MDNHVVIMAGGIGSRFWPMSTPECPKQFIDVMGQPEMLWLILFMERRMKKGVKNLCENEIIRGNNARI